MSEKNQVKVDLIADPAGLKPGYQKALAEQKAFQQGFDQQNASWMSASKAKYEKMVEGLTANQRHVLREEARAAAEAQRELLRIRQQAGEVETKFIENLRRQADTLGMSRGALIRYDAQQDVLTDTGRKVVANLADQIDAYERKQLVLARVANMARIAAAAFAAAGAAAAASSVRLAAEAERSEARLGAMHRATGMSSGFSRAELDDMVDDLARRTPHNDERIRDAMSVLMSFRQVSGDTFRETMTMAAGLSELMGRDLTGAVHTLGRALEDPVQGLTQLRLAGIFFSATQKDMIKDLVEHGRHAEAVAIILQRLRSSGFGNLAEEINKPGGYTRAISGASKATGELFEALGKTSVVKAPTLFFLDAVTEKFTTLRNAIENGTWFERLSLVFEPSGAVFMPKRARAVSPEEQSERDRAREAAAATAFDRGFEAQEAGLKEFIKKKNEEDRKEAEERLARARRGSLSASFTGSPEFAPPIPQAAIDQALERNDANRAYVLALERAREGTLWDEENAQSRVDSLTDEAIARRKAADEVRASLDPYHEYQETIRRLALLQKSGAITHDEYAQAAAMAAGKIRTSLEDTRDVNLEVLEDIKRAVEGFGTSVSRSLGQMTASGTFSLRGLGEQLRNFTAELFAIQYQRRLIQPGLDAGTRFLDQLFTPTYPDTSGFDTSGFGNVDWGGLEQADFSAGYYHSGGVVGRDGRRRHRNLRAPRMHRGGLLPNEIPIIAERGEEVLTRSDPRHRWNSGGTMPKVTVNVINQSGTPVNAEVGEPQFDPEGMVVSIVLRDLETGGPIRDRFEQMRGGPR